jgi:hypothetical protein
MKITAVEVRKLTEGGKERESKKYNGIIGRELKRGKDKIYRV